MQTCTAGAERWRLLCSSSSRYTTYTNLRACANNVCYVPCPRRSCPGWPGVALIRLALAAGHVAVLRRSHRVRTKTSRARDCCCWLRHCCLTCVVQLCWVENRMNTILITARGRRKTRKRSNNMKRVKFSRFVREIGVILGYLFLSLDMKFLCIILNVIIIICIKMPGACERPQIIYPRECMLLQCVVCVCVQRAHHGCDVVGTELAKIFMLAHTQWSRGIPSMSDNLKNEYHSARTHPARTYVVPQTRQRVLCSAMRDLKN